MLALGSFQVPYKETASVFPIGIIPMFCLVLITPGHLPHPHLDLFFKKVEKNKLLRREWRESFGTKKMALGTARKLDTSPPQDRKQCFIAVCNIREKVQFGGMLQLQREFVRGSNTPQHHQEEPKSSAPAWWPPRREGSIRKHPQWGKTCIHLLMQCCLHLDITVPL